MAPTRKRSRPTAEAPDEESDREPPFPSRRPDARRSDAHRRPVATRQESSEDEDEDEDEAMDSADSSSEHPPDQSTYSEAAKKLVRLALATESRRTTLRRTEISHRCLDGSHQQFRKVFDEAQRVLIAVFGMKMVEVPGRSNLTVAQRRAAQKEVKSGLKSYMVVSTLREAHKTNAAIFGGIRSGADEVEAAYVAIAAVLVTIVALSGGAIEEPRLDRLMKRLQIAQETPVDKTEKLMIKLTKDGYLIKHKDSSSGEEVVEYSVGPRGKVEIGKRGIEGLVQTVYGPGGGDALEGKLQRSLKLLDDPVAPPAGNGTSRTRRRRTEDEREEEEEESED